LEVGQNCIFPYDVLFYRRAASPVIFFRHLLRNQVMPGTKQGAARNPWIQHIKRSVYVSPHQANMSSECSDNSRLGSGTSAGRGGSTDAGIVRKQTSLSCESSSGGCELGFQQTQ
jgi:hypothetical protein